MRPVTTGAPRIIGRYVCGRGTVRVSGNEAIGWAAHHRRKYRVGFVARKPTCTCRVSWLFRAFSEFAATDLPGRVHQALIEINLGGHIIDHISTDSTVVKVATSAVPPKAIELSGTAEAAEPAVRCAAGEGNGLVDTDLCRDDIER